MNMRISKILQTLAVVTVLTSTAVNAQTELTGAVPSSEAAVAGGNYREAITNWSTIIDQIRADGQTTTALLSTSRGSAVGLSLAKLLLRRGEAYQRIGFYNRADVDLQEALTLANGLSFPALQSMVTGSLAELHTAARHNRSFKGPLADPLALLETSLDHALDTGVAELVSTAGVRLGTWHLDSGNFQVAFGTLQDAVLEADSTQSLLLQANARIKYARAARLASYTDDAIEILRNALKRIDAMPEGYSRAELALSVGRESAIFGGATANNIGVPALKSVVAMAGALADKRQVASALGYLGDWYLETGDELRAIEMLERAVGVAPDAHDLAIDWEWDLAKIYRARGDSASAIDSYRRSIRHIDRVRQDIPVSYVDGRSSFQETRAPIYFALADLLLRQSDATTNYDDSQALLFEAQSVMEQVKGSELQDYFRDTCVINQSSSIGADLAAGAAVVYPIILPDRLALLLNIDGVYYHYSSAVSATTLRSEVTLLAEMLRDFESDEAALKVHAGRVYDWVITPLRAQLELTNSTTLFFVPDGVLRTIPLAALWSGEEYLMESYEIASAPGLTLLNAEPLAKSKRRTLVAGLSLPGEAISKLPDDYYVDAFSETLPPGANPPTRGSVESLRSADNDERVRLWHRLGAVESEVQLPDQNDLPSTVLLDDAFKIDTFRDEVVNSSYQIVHVASHGYFGGQVEDSWIMTHDDLIDLGELSDLFKPKEFSDQPVELLILSACQTAEGNDLAPLGLSGVALTSGARSVLGSLWVVADVATQVLMSGFYEGLGTDGASKASALRSAQRQVLEIEELSHPYFWAPFILVGNWQ